MILFPKKHSLAFDPQDYRPICLLSVLAKLLDKILVRRLHTYLSTNSLLPLSQSGFRPHFSTSDQLLRLLQITSDQFNIRHPTLLIALDFTAAFDSVWHLALLLKLRFLAIPTTFIRFIAGYLHNRSARVRIYSELSQPFPLRTGVPQGSPLSPVLFSIFVADIPQPPPPVRLLQYADDTAVLAPLLSVRRINTVVAPYLHQLETWCAIWRLRLNPGKTQTTLFRAHRNSLSVSRNPAGLRLTLGGRPLRHAPTLKYLGLVLDQYLTFRPHFKQLWPRFLRRGGLLSRLRGTTWGVSTRLLLNTYKVFVRPLATYGHVAWAPQAATNPRLLAPFVRHERARVRHASRLPPRYPTAALMERFPFPPLTAHIKSLFLRHLRRMRHARHPYWQELTARPPKGIRHIKSPLHLFSEWDHEPPD